MIKKGTRIKIIQINKASAWYKDRKELIGKTGYAVTNLDYWKDTKYHYGWIKLDGNEFAWCFHQVGVKILK